jgi:hypothetical protein
MRRRRTDLRALGLGLLILLSWGEVRATDRIVGADSPGGGAYLVKHFSVSQGTVIVGVSFVNNDPQTVFPEIKILQGPAKRVSEAKLLAESKQVRPVTAHRVEVGVPPLVMTAAADIYVAVSFPANAGVQDAGVGPGIGAMEIDADAPRNCYFAADANGDLGAMDVDYQMDLLFLGAGKTASEKSEGHAPLVEDARVHPNPFNPSVTVEFDVPRMALVEVGIYDIAGRLVRTLLNEPRPAGVHRSVWDGKNANGRSVATGIYIARVRIGETVLARKLVLAK